MMSEIDRRRSGGKDSRGSEEQTRRKTDAKAYLVCACAASATIESASMSLTGLASHSSISFVLLGRARRARSRTYKQHTRCLATDAFQQKISYFCSERQTKRFDEDLIFDVASGVTQHRSHAGGAFRLYNTLLLRVVSFNLHSRSFAPERLRIATSRRIAT